MSFLNYLTFFVSIPVDANEQSIQQIVWHWEWWQTKRHNEHCEVTI